MENNTYTTANIFTRPERKENWITEVQVAEVVEYIRNHPSKAECFSKQYSDNFIHAIQHIYTSMDVSEITATLNSIHAIKDYFQVVIGKLALRIKLPAIPVTNYNFEIIKTTVAANLLTALADLSIINRISEPVREVDEKTGKVKYVTQTYLTFGHEDTDSTYIHGIEQEAGIIHQRAHKVRTGGKPRKLNKNEKSFLKELASFELRLIQEIDRDTFIDFCKSEQDYINVKLGKTPNYDVIIANELVERQADKFEVIQSLDKFYLPMWMDYRTRLNYEFTEQYITPTQAKWLYEAAEPVKVTEAFRNDMKYSAVVIVDGRITHHKAVEAYNANPEKYQAALRETVYTNRQGKVVDGEVQDYKVVLYKETMYNRRLADAILADETRFLLGEDCTNGGLQHGGIAFKSEGMMVPSNVGGANTQMDSHQTVADAFNMTRLDAKQINQELLHGAALQGMAKRLGISTEEMIDFSIKAYGPEVVNINKVAKWGSDIAKSNGDTALMWKTRDGFSAQSINYFSGAEIKVYSLSNNKAGYSQATMLREMPAAFTVSKKPEPITEVKEAKVNGLYANIIHSIDATALRDVVRGLRKAGVRSAIFIHDNFFVNQRMDVVRDSYKQAILEEFDFSGIQAAINDIVANSTKEVPYLPELQFGNATKEMIEKSKYFLAA